MRQLFSTDASSVRYRFRQWSDFCEGARVRRERTSLDDERFEAVLEGERVGSLFVTRSRYTAIKMEATKQTIRHQGNSDSLFLNLKLSGHALITVDAQTFVQNVDDFVIYDNNAPHKVVHPDGVDQLAVEFPRGRMEEMLGASQNYRGFTMPVVLPSASLLKSFLFDLLRVRDRLSSDATERMTSVGTDLMVACVAERLALETPAPLRGTVAVQRAKAYIEANLGDPELNPARVAAATNVSLRYLQERFRERGRHVAEWIWQRRLETAATRLSDPILAHLSLDEIAYGCGFLSQAHFSRRFKHRYETSPSDYRRSAPRWAPSAAG